MPYLMFAAAIWGISYGINCRAMEFATAPAMGLLFAAVGIAIFCPFACHGSVRKLRCHLAAIGALQLGAMYFFYQNAMAHLESHQIALFGLTTPIFVGLASDFFDRMPPWRHLFFALISVAVCAFAVGGSIRGERPLLRGFLEYQASNLCYGLGQVLYCRLKLAHGEVADRSALFWMNCGSVLPLVAAMFLIRAPALPVQFSWAAGQTATLLYLGIVAGGIGNYLWNKGIALTSAGVLLVCNNMPAIFGLIFGRILYGEGGSWPRQLFAVVVLLAAIALQDCGGKKSFSVETGTSGGTT